MKNLFWGFNILLIIPYYNRNSIECFCQKIALLGPDHGSCPQTGTLSKFNDTSMDRKVTSM